MRALLILALAASVAPQQDLPRFRAGATLVRLDAYVSHNGVPLTDLKADDFEVFEDGVAQRVESLQLIKPRASAPQSLAREPNSVRESRSMAEDPDARVFVLFLDTWHVHLEGSHRARAPITNVLNQVIGQDDIVGVMTPEMSARDLALARRTGAIESMLSKHWDWGQRGRLTTPDPLERDFQACYPKVVNPNNEELVRQLISRRRERKTLNAMKDLIVHLEDIREERKFVIMVSQGWVFPRNDDTLTNLDRKNRRLPGVDPVGIGPDGRLSQGDTRNEGDLDRCERERFRIAGDDLASDFRDTVQRANRANVTFYAVDPRGLVPFDETISERRKILEPFADHAEFMRRQVALRELAENTDGYAVLNTNDTEKALRRLVADVSSYYLLGYYSTNTKLDGKFRKLTVRVKRAGVDVRARPGYLAPTAKDVAAARTLTTTPAARTIAPEAAHRALRRGPATGREYVVAADARFRRTERLRLEIPRSSTGNTYSARLLGRNGHAIPLEVAVTERSAETVAVVADITLAPLAVGEYVLEVLVEKDGKTERAVYAFRIIP